MTLEQVLDQHKKAIHSLLARMLDAEKDLAAIKARLATLETRPVAGAETETERPY